MFSVLLLFTLEWFSSLSSSVQGSCAGGSAPKVLLNTGSVEGLCLTSALGRSYYSFRGIPYAAPPVGELRFKAPQPVVSWSGVLRAVEEPPACLQPWREVEFPITYSEDCLYLNVYTPYLQHPSGRAMPVIVWIHGGKFYQGSGTSHKYGADFFLTKDIVVVSVNYRLGVFGYLNMNVSDAQGNAALKDRVAALRWVKKDISMFGGDPNSVTIAGGSSGAADVNLLYMSPMAKGLFHTAISHSGTALCFWSFLPSTVSLGLQMAHSLGCPINSPQAAVSCLRAINGSQLAEKQMILEGVEGLDNPFVPSVEAALGEDVFLPDTPQNMLKNHAGDEPYILGITNGEGEMFVDNPHNNPDQFSNLEDDLISYLPVHISRNESPEALQKISSTIMNFYIGENSSLNSTMYGFVNFMSDRQFSYCVLKTVQALSTTSPVYLYYFTFEGEFQNKKRSAKLLNMSGVCHGDELGYFFYRNYTIVEQNNMSAYPRDMAMVDKMMTLWTNFAAYGNPTPPLFTGMNITWMPVKGEITKHLIIGDVLEMVLLPLLEERVAFWDALYRFLLADLKSISDVRNYPFGIITAFLLLVSVVWGVVLVFKFRKNGYSPL